MMTPKHWLVRLYLGFSWVSGPLFWIIGRYRLAKGKEMPARYGERWGRSLALCSGGPLVWFHAASVGETLSLLGLITQLRQHRPDVEILVTSATVTSAQRMAALLPAGAIHQFVPFDTVASVRRFLAHWQPDVAVWTESELWPRLLLETSKKHIPMFLINARVSKKTQARWRKSPLLAQSLLSGFAKIFAVEAKTVEIILATGMRGSQVLLSGSLKEDNPPPGFDPLAYDLMQRALGARLPILASSTHQGEEAIVLDAFINACRALVSQAPLLILAPRHPGRAEEIVAQMQAHAITFSRRSEGTLPNADTQVYLADTIGEMGLWYRLCPISFVGGSLVCVGGHNPYEPAQLGSAIIHGPHVFNFSEIYQRLDQAEAAVQVRDATGLKDALIALGAHDAAQTISARALVIAKSQQGATQKVLIEILGALAGPKT
jgi:3-deoxy-D-manno-octulosonic-acid transferase